MSSWILTGSHYSCSMLVFVAGMCVVHIIFVTYLTSIARKIKLLDHLFCTFTLRLWSTRCFFLYFTLFVAGYFPIHCWYCCLVSAAPKHVSEAMTWSCPCFTGVTIANVKNNQSRGVCTEAFVAIVCKRINYLVCTLQNQRRSITVHL